MPHATVSPVHTLLSSSQSGSPPGAQSGGQKTAQGVISTRPLQSGASAEQAPSGPSGAGNGQEGGNFRSALDGLMKQGYDPATARKLAAWLVQGHLQGPLGKGLSDKHGADTAHLPGAVDGQASADYGKFLPPFLAWNLPVEGLRGRNGLGTAIAGRADRAGAVQGGLPSGLADFLQRTSGRIGSDLGSTGGGERAFLNKLLPALQSGGQSGTAFNHSLLAQLTDNASATMAQLAGANPAHGSALSGAGLLTPQLPGTTVTPAGLVIAQPIQHPGWPQSVGERVQWMLGQHVQAAHIRLNPPELGPIEVRILMQHDQTSVQFNAHHAHVRDALESTLPRLRDMLGDQGVQLGQLNVNVSSHPFAGHTPQHNGTGHSSGGGGSTGALHEDIASGTMALDDPRLRQVALGMLDEYA